MKTALMSMLVFLSAAALSAPANCQSADNAASKKASQEPGIAKSISQSVAGTLQYAEGSLLGLAEAMPEDKYAFVPSNGKFEGVVEEYDASASAQRRRGHQDFVERLAPIQESIA